jgi:hypothetical protein
MLEPSPSYLVVSHCQVFLKESCLCRYAPRSENCEDSIPLTARKSRTRRANEQEPSSSIGRNRAGSRIGVARQFPVYRGLQNVRQIHYPALCHKLNHWLAGSVVGKKPLPAKVYQTEAGRNPPTMQLTEKGTVKPHGKPNRCNQRMD